MENLETIMGDLGLNLQQVDGMVEGVDDDVADLLEGRYDVGAFIARKAPQMPQNQVAQLREGIRSCMNVIEQAYSAAFAVHMQVQATRPNASVTLYATSVGVACTGGTIYGLRPRQGGALMGSDFQFNRDMVLERMFVEPTDAAAGFTLVGNTAGFSDDKLLSFRYDTHLVIARPEIDVKETPWASLTRRRPDQQVAFTAQVYLDDVAANEAIFHGLTLTYQERACGGWIRNWKSAQDVLPFAELTRGILQRVRGNRVLTPRTTAATRPGMMLRF